MHRTSRSFAVLAAAVAAAPAAVAQTFTGPSSSESSYIVPVAPGVQSHAILTVGDSVNKKPDGVTDYRMVGIPDGLGVMPNPDGSMTVLMNHELGQTSGITRAHGQPGAFVSQWNISARPGSDFLRVNKGEDFNATPTSIFTWNPALNAYNPPGTANYGRFCSGDLPGAGAFRFDGLGTQNRIYMNGEEIGSEGRAFGHVATGPDAGTTYELPRLGKFSWENSVASPHAQAKTIVAGMDDASTNGQVYMYVGSKTGTGNEVDRAGLTNGSLYAVRVTGVTQESRTNALGGAGFVGTGTFDLFNHGNVANQTGAVLDATDVANGVTSFLRPEDGAWDPLKPNDFYFLTTDRYDQQKDNVGTQAGRTRLYRLRFTDIANPESGGAIEAVLDGTEPVQMMDNMTAVAGVDGVTRFLIQEDVGGVAHNGKIWLYDPSTDGLTLIAQHDPARFGDLGAPPSGKFSNDEESSGIIDARDTLGLGWFVLDVQAHGSVATMTAPGGELVEYGQLLAMYVPQAVPEPSSLGLLGLAGLAALRRRRR